MGNHELQEVSDITISPMKSMKVFYPLLVVVGVVSLLIPSTLHMIIEHFHLGEGEGGLLPLAFYSGVLLSIVLANQLLQKLSVRTLIVSSALLVCLSLIAASVSQWYALFVFFFFFTGLGNGTLLVIPGIYVTNVLRKESAHVQSMLFGCLALGYTVGPLFPGLIEHLQISWRWAIAFPGALILLCIIPMTIAKLERIEKAEPLSPRIIKDIIAFDRRFFVGIIAALILSGGAITGFITWLITFLINERGMILGSAHIVLCGVGITMALGRLTCGYFAKRFPAYKILLSLTIASAVLLFLAPLPSAVAANTALFLVASFSFAGIFPLLLAAAAVYPKSESSSAYTLFCLALVGGKILTPYALGQVFEYVGAVAGMYLCAVLLIGVLACLFFIKREIPLREHAHYKTYPSL